MPPDNTPGALKEPAWSDPYHQQVFDVNAICKLYNPGTETRARWPGRAWSEVQENINFGLGEGIVMHCRPRSSSRGTEGQGALETISHKAAEGRKCVMALNIGLPPRTPNDETIRGQ